MIAVRRRRSSDLWQIATARYMTTTAEVVEAEQQRDLVRKLGHAEMQGYLSARKTLLISGHYCYPLCMRGGINRRLPC